MAVDLEALQFREIEREGKFTPIQFGDIARGAINVGQQFSDNQAKRAQAAQMQKLLNGGQNALFQAMGQLDPEDQKLMFGGNAETIRSVTGTQDGLLGGWKRLGEIQAQRAGAQASTFGEKADIFGKANLITPKEQLSFQKPKAGSSGVSREGRLILQKTLIDAADKKGSTLTKAESNQIGQQVSIDLGIPELGESKIIQFAITSGALPEKEIERERFEEDKTQRVNTAVRKMGAKFTAKKREVVIAANELNKAVTGGVFGDKFKNLISGTFLDGLKERLQLSEDSPTVIATIMNSFLKGKVGDEEEAKRIRRVKSDPKFKELFNNKEFNKVMVSLSTLMTKVLRLESGAAITGTDIEDKKNNFGFDAIGTPESFLIGIGNFMEGLRADIVQISNEEPDEKARSFFKKSFESNKLASPFDLPTRAGQSQAIDTETITQDLQTLQSELDALDALDAKGRK